MARPIFKNRVVETTQTTGTGTLDLDGAQVGYQSFANSGVGSGSKVYYTMVASVTSPTKWEIGEGTFTIGSPNTLSRDRVIASTNSGSKVSILSGETWVVTLGAVDELLNAIIDTIDSDLETAGSAGAYTVTTTRELTPYDGYSLTVEANHDNPAGACTLNPDGLGAVSIKLNDGSDPYAGAIQSGGKYDFQYDGTNLLLKNPSPRLVDYTLESMCKSRCSLSASGTISIRDSHNVSSVTDHGVGDYSFNFSTAFENADRAVSFSVNVNHGSNFAFSACEGATPAAGSTRCLVGNFSNVAADPTTVYMEAYGALA